MILHLPKSLALASCLMLLADVPSSAQGLLTIEGTASYRERIALPPGATFEATLEDVSQADAAAQVLGEARIEQPGPPPFQFKIEYDPAQIQPNHIYVVRSRIVEGNRVLLATDHRYQVLTMGHGSEIGMMMLQRTPRPIQQQTAKTSLRGTYWKLEEVAGNAVLASEQQREPHLIFSAQGDRVTGSGGCNRLSGSYEARGASLRFAGIASTRMACARGMETESSFLQSLGQVRSWMISGQELQLMSEDGKPILKFRAGPPGESR